MLRVSPPVSLSIRVLPMPPITLWSEGGNSHYMLHVPSSYCSWMACRRFISKANGSSYEPTLLSVSVFDGEAVVDVFRRL